MNYESKLNPLAEEFIPLSRRRLSATAPEFYPGGHVHHPVASDNVAMAQRFRAQPGSSHAAVTTSCSRLSTNALEFFPREHVRPPIASDDAQAQRSRAQPGSSHSGSESSDKDAKVIFIRTIYVGDIKLTLGSVTEEELQREFSNCRDVTRGDAASRPQRRGWSCTGVGETPRSFGKRVVGSDNFCCERQGALERKNRRGEITECWAWRKKEVVNRENGDST